MITDKLIERRQHLCGSMPCDSFVASDFFRALLNKFSTTFNVAVEGTSASGDVHSELFGSGDAAALQGLLVNVSSPDNWARLHNQKPPDEEIGQWEAMIWQKWVE